MSRSSSPAPRLDGPPDLPAHLAFIAGSGEPTDSSSMDNAEVTLARCKTLGSARIYATVLSEFFTFMQSRSASPIDATRDDIDVFLARLHRYAQSTQQCWWGVLTSYFQRAVDRDKIRRSPFAGRKRPLGEPDMPTPALTRQEAQRLLDSLSADFGHPDRDLIARRDYALISTLLFMCLRCSELTSLTWQSIRRDRGKVVLNFKGKGRKAATLTLPEALHEVLLSWKSAYEAKTGVELRGNDPIFLPVHARDLKVARSRRSKKQPLRYLANRSVTRLVSARISDLELNVIDGVSVGRFAAHSMRATGATLSIEGGADVVDLQALLRHANIDTTLRYIRRLEDRAARAVAHIDLKLRDQVATSRLSEEQEDPGTTPSTFGDTGTIDHGEEAAA